MVSRICIIILVIEAIIGKYIYIYEYRRDNDDWYLNNIMNNNNKKYDVHIIQYVYG